MANSIIDFKFITESNLSDSKVNLESIFLDSMEVLESTHTQTQNLFPLL